MTPEEEARELLAAEFGEKTADAFGPDSDGDTILQRYVIRALTKLILTRPNPALPADLERALSDARAANPYEPFSDENGTWNEGFCAAWETARAAIYPENSHDT